jgi:hypothetical protein
MRRKEEKKECVTCVDGGEGEERERESDRVRPQKKIK